ncbi:MAG: xanthine dehydrogenase family protein molybdopterin-binding subunit [Treponema sp.]|jgi:CO/xanthine dehydrogenase Mo-binding subunit|nr:xanthine dehydrogenase family protein molybdopterin-binding subunit [Treponema sp.]
MDAPCFLEDIYHEKCLYAATVRSPVAKGILKFILYPNFSSSYTLITARHIPGENRLHNTSLPILADGRLSYIGEPVALLLGPVKSKVEEYAAKCNVVTDEEEAVFSPGGGEHGSVIASREFQTGDTERAFASAAKIIHGDYSTGIQEHWYAEPVGAVTWFKNYPVETGAKNKKKEKMLVVKTATQWPYHVKRSVSDVLRIDPAALVVEPTSLNLHMDGKLWYPSLIACHAALGTLITGKPVRLVLSRKEDFLYSPKRCKTDISISSALDEKDAVTGMKIKVYVNLGSYEVYSDEILDQTCLGSLGFYQFDSISLTAGAERTNIPPQGPFSGFGMAQGSFAIERHISQIADSIKQDPAVWRKKNLSTVALLKGQTSAGELINAVSSMSDYHRKWAAYELLRQSRKGKSLLAVKGENLKGIGIALGYQGNGLLYPGENKNGYSIEVTLTKEGDLEIKTSMSRSDDDLGIIWARIASGILSIEPDMVRIVTKGAPDSGPSCASANITTLTKLVEKCCLAVRSQRFRAPLPITVRRSAKPHSGALWEGRFTPPDGKTMDISGFLRPGRAAAVVEVTINPAECIPEIRNLWMEIDGGKIISEDNARRNLTCAAAQALGWVFAEKIEYVNGTLSKELYDDYAIPNPVDIPPINIDFLPDNSKEPKGIGELPFTCLPAAFLQAVSQAMDHCFYSIPLKREDIWEAVQRGRDDH